MGFWSSLAKIGGVVAAPFTGGASLAIPAALQVGGEILGGLSQSKTQNRNAENNFALEAFRDLENARINRETLDLRRRDEDRAALNDAYRNAIRSALAKNMRDASFSRPEGVPMIAFSGGARPSALGPEGREAAALLLNRATRTLMEGPAPHAQLPELSAPELKKAGFWENLLGAGSLGMSALGRFGKMTKSPDEDHLPEVASGGSFGGLV